MHFIGIGHSFFDRDRLEGSEILLLFLLPTIRALVAALSVGPAVLHRAVEVGKPLLLAVSTRRTRKRYQDYRDKPQ